MILTEPICSVLKILHDAGAEITGIELYYDDPYVSIGKDMKLRINHEPPTPAAIRCKTEFHQYRVSLYHIGFIEVKEGICLTTPRDDDFVRRVKAELSVIKGAANA